MSPAFIARALLGVLLSGSAFVAAITTHASAPSATPVLESAYWHRPGSADAREFLEHLDARRYAEAYHATGHGFGDHDLARFAQVERERRARLGAPKCRTPVSQQHIGSSPADGLPEKIVVRFRTEFEHVTASELVSLVRDVDGSYRVDSYGETAMLGSDEACPLHFVPPAAASLAAVAVTASARAPQPAPSEDRPSSAPPTSPDRSHPRPEARHSP